VAEDLRLPHEIVTTGAWTRAGLLQLALRQAVPSDHLFLAGLHGIMASRTAELARGDRGYSLDGAAGEILISDLSFLAVAVRERRVLEIAQQIPLLVRLGVRRSLRELMFFLRLEDDGIEPRRSDETAWLRVVPARADFESRLHRSCRGIEALMVHSIGPAPAYVMATWRPRGAITVSPYADARVQDFAFALPVTMRTATKSLARGAFPEVSRRASALGEQIAINEGMSARYIALDDAAWIARALRELPPTLQDVFDVDLLCRRLPWLRDPARSNRLFDVIAIAYWIEALRGCGLTLQ
jgi:hypothetical protein